MIRLAAVYSLIVAAFYAMLALARVPISAAVVLMPLMVWPDIVLLTGLGRIGNRASWFCRILGMAAIMWTFISKFIFPR